MTPPTYVPKQASAAELEQRAQLNAQAACRRLGLNETDGAFFLTVFDYVRQAELSGEDTESLWRSYRRDRAADLAVAAYVEGIASTRQFPRPKL